MNEEQKAKFQFARDMLTNEQLAEMDFVIGIVNRSTDAHRFTYKGQTYYTFICGDVIDGEQRALKITIGLKGWVISPADAPIKEYLPL